MLPYTTTCTILTSEELIFRADTPPRKRLLLTTPRPSVRLERVLLLLLRDSQDPLWPIESIIVSLYDIRCPRRIVQLVRSLIIEVLRRGERRAYEHEACNDLVLAYHAYQLEAGARVTSLEDIRPYLTRTVVAAMAEAEASRVRKWYNSNGFLDQGHTNARDMLLLEFLNANLWTSKATEGVGGLTRWFEKIESGLH
ncbi:hypothetical protein Tco_1173564 [Tanacetum coccineum]